MTDSDHHRRSRDRIIDIHSLSSPSSSSSSFSPSSSSSSLSKSSSSKSSHRSKSNKLSTKQSKYRRDRLLINDKKGSNNNNEEEKKKYHYWKSLLTGGIGKIRLLDNKWKLFLFGLIWKLFVLIIIISIGGTKHIPFINLFIHSSSSSSSSIHSLSAPLSFPSSLSPSLPIQSPLNITYSFECFLIIYRMNSEIAQYFHDNNNKPSSLSSSSSSYQAKFIRIINANNDNNNNQCKNGQYFPPTSSCIINHPSNDYLTPSECTNSVHLVIDATTPSTPINNNLFHWNNRLTSRSQLIFINNMAIFSVIDSLAFLDANEGKEKQLFMKILLNRLSIAKKQNREVLVYVPYFKENYSNNNNNNNNGDNNNNNLNRPHFSDIFFSRLFALDKLLSIFPSVLQMDLDAWFTPVACLKSIDSFFPSSASLLQQDSHWLNCGVAGYRRSRFFKRFLSRWINEYHTGNYRKFPADQTAFHNIIIDYYHQCLVLNKKCFRDNEDDRGDYWNITDEKNIKLLMDSCNNCLPLHPFDSPIITGDKQFFSYTEDHNWKFPRSQSPYQSSSSSAIYFVPPTPHILFSFMPKWSFDVINEQALATMIFHSGHELLSVYQKEILENPCSP